MFYLVLPAPTLTAGFPNLRCLYRTTLAFRPPPDYGSGGWGFESLAARQKCRSEAIKQGKPERGFLTLAVLRPVQLLLGHDDVKELGGVDEVVVAVVA